MKNRKLASEMIYEGRIIRLRLDEVELPGGERATREVIEHPGAAAIVPLDERGDIHLVRQYRDAVGEEMLEIPAGKMKPGEDPADCARRELREELGLEAARLQHLSTFYSTPGFCDEVMHVYLAEGLGPVSGEMDTEEYITGVTRSMNHLEDLIGELRDAKSIAGILLAGEMLALREGATE